MDASRFDTLTTTLSANPSRRRVFAALAGTILGAVAGQLGDEAALASKKKKKKKKKNKSGSSPDQAQCPSADEIAYLKASNREGCAFWYPGAGQAECIAYHDGCVDFLAGCPEKTYGEVECNFTYCDATGPMALAAGDPPPSGPC